MYHKSMLTKIDLEQIAEIIKPLANDIVSVKNKVGTLEDKVFELSAQNDSISNRIDILGIRVDGLKLGFEKLSNVVMRQQKELLSKKNKILEFVEEEDIKIKNRVQRIEEHLN